MKKWILSLILILSSIPASSELPSPKDVGVSFLIGSMGAIQGKYFFTDSDAAVLAVEFLDHPWSVFYADYNHHFRKAWTSEVGKQMTPYVGIGFGAGFWDRLKTCGRWNCRWNEATTGTGNGLFMRGVLGIEWFLKGRPYSLFLEAAPSLMWYPSSNLVVDGGVGGRFYF